MFPEWFLGEPTDETMQDILTMIHTSYWCARSRILESQSLTYSKFEKHSDTKPDFETHCVTITKQSKTMQNNATQNKSKKRDAKSEGNAKNNRHTKRSNAQKHVVRGKLSRTKPRQIKNSETNTPDAR